MVSGVRREGSEGKGFVDCSCQRVWVLWGGSDVKSLNAQGDFECRCSQPRSKQCKEKKDEGWSFLFAHHSLDSKARET